MPNGLGVLDPASREAVYAMWKLLERGHSWGTRFFGGCHGPDKVEILLCGGRHGLDKVEILIFGGCHGPAKVEILVFGGCRGPDKVVGTNGLIVADPAAREVRQRRGPHLHSWDTRFPYNFVGTNIVVLDPASREAGYAMWKLLA